MKLPLLVVGSSGHAGSVLDAIELADTHRVVGLLDSFAAKGTTRLGYTVLGAPEEAGRISAELDCRAFFVAVGDNWARWKIFQDLAAAIPDVEFPCFRHPSAIVARTARLGPGSIAMAGTFLMSYAIVGQGCIVNVASAVNHDCLLADYASVSGGVHMGGGSQIGIRSSIGVGACLREKVIVGPDTVVGAGAVVVADLPAGIVAYGNPAKVVRQRADDERYMR